VLVCSGMKPYTVKLFHRDQIGHISVERYAGEQYR